MKELTIEDFLKPCYDLELSQYKILNKLKEIRNEFTKMKIYPHLTELIFISSQLENLVSIKTTPVDSGELTYDDDYTADHLSHIIPEMKEEDFENIFEVILWVLPLLNELIEEGFVINDFIDDNIDMKSMGQVPKLNTKGFIFINDQDESFYNIYKYEFSRSSLIEGEYELNTSFLERIKRKDFYNNLTVMKKTLAEKYMIAPNPPVFLFDTSYKFPYYNAILPLCRQKMISYISGY